LLSPLESEAAPETVQSALREVRPDDLDTIFDDALFGAPVAETTNADSLGGSGVTSATVQVGAVEWFMERESQAAGPFRLERLRELWHQGGLDPDTLVWCEAWAHWRPLSRVPELVAALTDAGLPTVGADASVATAPAREKADTKDKVASVLPSLVAEEESWLMRMKEEREQAKEEARSALLDAPSAPAPVPVPVPVPVPPPQVMAPVPPYQGYGVPVAPPVIPALVLPMAPPEASEPPRRGRGLVLGALMGSTAVGLVVGALLLLPRLQGSSEQVPTQVAPAPAPVAVAPQPVPAPAPVAVAPQPVPAPVQAPAPIVSQPAAPAVAVAPVAQPAAPAPQAPAPVAPPVEKPAPQVVTATASSSPKPVLAAATPEKPPKIVVAEARPVEQDRIARAAESALQRRSPPPPTTPAAPPVKAPAPVAPSVKVGKSLQNDTPASNPNDFEDSLDKDFEKELFEGKKAEDPRSKRTVYLPPEPGKESLSTSDVMEVVSSHKSDIVNCIQEHEPAAPEAGAKGRFVVRWRVQPSGSAQDVLLETETLKGTPFARCIEGAVRTWKFPQHRVQSQEPVRFPFTY
jgi:hypothetical protein